MAKLFIKEISRDEMYEKIKQDFKHPNLESIGKDESDNVIIETKWMKYTLKLTGNSLAIKPRWVPGKLALIIILAITGLFLIVPLLVVFYISIVVVGKEQKEVRNILQNILG